MNNPSLPEEDSDQIVDSGDHDNGSSVVARKYWDRFVIVNDKGDVVGAADDEDGIKKTFSNLPTPKKLEETTGYKIYQVSSAGEISIVKTGFSRAEVEKILDA